MTVRDLIKQFLDITDVSNQSYGKVIGYSPSSVSKLLSGMRVPSEKIMRSIIDKSAILFSKKLYEKKLVYKVDEIFTYTYDFRDVNELYSFIKDAFNYYYTKTSDNEALRNPILYNSTSSFLTSYILNRLCISLSDILSEEDEVEIYSTISIFKESSYDFISRIKYNGDGKKKAKMHQLISSRAYNPEEILKLMKSYDALLERFDVNFFTCPEKPSQEIFFVPNRNLFIFTYFEHNFRMVHSIYDLPDIIRITKPVYLRFQYRLSFEKDKLTTFMSDISKDYIDRIFSDVQYLFSSRATGILLDEDDFIDGAMEENPYLGNIIYLIKSSLEKDIKFYFSYPTLVNLESLGDVNYPLIDSKYLKDIDYKEYLESYKKDFFIGENELLLTNLGIRNVSCIATKDQLYLYSYENKLNADKIVQIPKTDEDLSEALDTTRMYQINKDSWDEIMKRDLDSIFVSFE